jgi:CRP/FNR family transcriptional regulator
MLLENKRLFADARPADHRADAVANRSEGDGIMIPHGESLFAPGLPRSAAYRVESGALCHYVVWPDGTHDVIEFAFPGEIIGLGSLAEHVSTAKAMVDTRVVPVEDDDLDQALSNDAALASRMSAANDREFDFLRRRALQPGLRPVLNRVAAYLIAVAGNACRSGETHVTAGTEGEAALSSMLDIPAVDISASLATLRANGLIAEHCGTYVIRDFAGLEALADA